jgi:hypothetical protein
MHLLDEVLAAYGGQDRWNQVDSIKIHQLIDGSLWQLKGVNGILDDSTVEIQPRNQRAWHRPLPKPGLRSSYSPGLVTIETDEEHRRRSGH